MSKNNKSEFQVKNYIVGPVNQFQRTKNIRANDYPYFRTENFAKINNFVIDSLNKLLGVNQEYRTVMITGSGTLGMEISGLNFTNEGDDVLVISSGSFGDRFVEILKRAGCNVEIKHVAFNKNLEVNDLETIKNAKRFKAVFVNHHETTTGHLHDLSIIRDFCNNNNSLLIADCMTSFLSDKSRYEISKCDVIITSSHKGMCCSPGLVFITYKRSLLNIPSNRIIGIYCDLKIYEKNAFRNQTPYTPAVGVIIELNDIFQLINTIGYEDWTELIRKRAISFRSEISGSWIIPKHRLSNFMTPILLPSESQISLKKIMSNLEQKYGVNVTPISGMYIDRLLRVSHVGDHSIEETLKLANHLKLIVS